MKDKLSALLKDPEFEKLSLSLKKPNIFKITNAARYEIRHSNFLAWLLNPKEGHGLGDIFIKRVLRDIFSDDKISWADEFSMDEVDLSNINIYREWNNIDILIETTKFVICIENKFFSKEHSQQLSRYKNILEKHFPYKDKGYVFLTSHGYMPENRQEQDYYILLSYHHIMRNLCNILEIFDDSISSKIKIYIKDYIEILEESIMKESVNIDLARRLYNNHKEAIDFILENKPDRMFVVLEIIQNLVEKKGYVLCSQNKGYCRFLTKKLNEILPRTGTGWKNKEPFLFELDFWPNAIRFKTAISPGNDIVRKKLSDKISKISGANTPQGKIWLVHFLFKKKIDVTSEKNDDKEIISAVEKILQEQKSFIEKIESEFVKIQEELSVYK